VRPRWNTGPSEIWLVRHGESVGNEADDRAHATDAEELALDERDADVPLSDRGRHQATRLGDWLVARAADERPTVALSSPYRRAADTAEAALVGTGVGLELDERLRERDLGILDGLTGRGIRARHPEEAARRSKLGKFYYSPPSGESWADVVLRVRSLLQDLQSGHDGERVWLFTHQAVIMAFRYVLEGLTEQQILDVDREVRIPNASVTEFRREGSHLELRSFARAVVGEELTTAEEPATGSHRG
jgi:broad specificity phosphatase PhoE